MRIVESPEHIAFLSRIRFGNHNNAMLIDRIVETTNYELSAIETKVSTFLNDFWDSSKDKEQQSWLNFGEITTISKEPTLEGVVKCQEQPVNHATVIKVVT